MKKQEFEVNMTISIPEGMVLISQLEYERLLSLENNSLNQKKERHLENKNQGWLSKKEFMEKYAKSDSKYNTRITELRDNPDFKKAYISPSNKEVWIDESIYQDFLIWKSNNKFR